MEKEVYEDTHYYKTVCEFSTSTSYTFLYDKKSSEAPRSLARAFYFNHATRRTDAEML